MLRALMHAIAHWWWSTLEQRIMERNPCHAYLLEVMQKRRYHGEEYERFLAKGV